MNPSVYRGIAAIWSGAVAVIKTYQSGGDVIAVIEGIDWMAVSVFVAMAWTFLRRPDDKSPKQVAAMVSKATDAAYAEGIADAAKVSKR